MPVVRLPIITRDMLRANPEFLFLFGDNVARAGLKGQAEEMRGEPNAVGIATKWEPARKKHSYFSDDDYERICEILIVDFSGLKEFSDSGGIIVIPENGLGTGLADLPNRAPRVFLFLQQLIGELDVNPI